MIYRYGVPIFFITFAPTESKNPICLYFCGEDVDLNDFCSMKSSDQERLRIVVKNPVACAKFFNLMVNLFIKHVLRSGSDRDGLFGRTSAYYGTVEQQGRLTLHLHLLLWIAGSYSPQQIRNKAMDAESTFAAEILAWLESCHQGEFSTGNSGDIEHKLEELGRPPLKIRPKPWWPDPCIALPRPPPEGDDPADLDRWFQQVCEITDEVVYLCNMHDCSHSKGCIRPPDFTCRARMPRRLVKYSYVDLTDGSLAMKKGEQWINTFSVILTYLIRCNSDVTCLLSGTQVRAVIAYVTDYVTKSSLKTYIIFDTVRSVLAGSAELIAKSETRALAAKKVITRIVNALTSQQEVGGPMICSHLMGHPDHYTDKRFQPCYWYSYVLTVDHAWTVPDESAEMAASEQVAMSAVGSEIRPYSKVDDWCFWPSEFANTSLHDYLTTTTVRRLTRSAREKLEHIHRSQVLQDDFESDDEEFGENDGDGQEGDLLDSAGGPYPFLPQHPKYETHAVYRLHPKSHLILNFIGSMLPRHDVGDREAYCRTMLTLFAPHGWRTGRELKSPDESWDEAFNRYEFSPSDVQIMKNMNLLYECQDSRDDYRMQRANAESLAHFLSPDVIAFLDDKRMEDELVGSMTNDELGAEVEDDFIEIGKRTSRLHREHNAMADFIRRFDAEAQKMEIASTVNSVRNVQPKNWTPTKWKAAVAQARASVMMEKRGLLPNDSDGTKSIPASAKSVNKKEGTGDVNILSLLDIEQNESTPLNGNGAADSQSISCTDHMKKIMERFTLNEEQCRAFLLVANHLVSRQDEPLLMYLGGTGGTGKSQVLKALSYFLEERKESHRFAVAAPTGSAASLIGGSTYHSLLAFGPNDTAEGVGASKVQDTLGPVEVIFIDEVSMLSTFDMYRISAQLCIAFKNYTVPFGGKSVIFAGDFAQLPPPRYWDLPLYTSRAANGLTAYGQKNMLGRAVWQMFTTAVILRKNMRQKGLTRADIGFRRALDNMRFNACTIEDIELLNTRVAGTEPGQPHLGQPCFRNVSIITAWNIHRDAINEVCSARFALEQQVPLHYFYSVDKIAMERDETSFTKSQKAEKKKRRQLVDVSPNLRQQLWDLPPSASKHIAGRLALCVGMPVLLKNNNATELCITNGAEARVVAWQAQNITADKQRLLTLFVELINPPKSVQIADLPENVVPIPYSSKTVPCELPDDTIISVTREQVLVLPNFAMTDYASQGRTRERNVVDLRNSKSHLAVYTSLSRCPTLEGTLILSPLDPSKVMGGLAPDLKRELRELEILDDITRMRVDGSLPSSISGNTRSDLITTYYGYYGYKHIPSHVHPALNWASASAIELRPPEYSEKWRLVGTDAKQEKKEPTKRKANEATIQPSEAKKQKKNHQPAIPDPTDAVPSLPGLVWNRLDWSCAYDALLTILCNTSHELGVPWTIATVNSNLLRLLTDGFAAVSASRTLSLESVRDELRDQIAALNLPDCPRYGPLPTSITRVVDQLFVHDGGYCTEILQCDTCGTVNDVSTRSSYLWSTGINSMAPPMQGPVTTSAILSDLLTYHHRYRCPLCRARGSLYTRYRFDSPPPFIFLEIPAEDSRFPDVLPEHTVTLTLDSSTQTWRLFGVIYLGGQHFTCRLVRFNGSIWYHDGITTGNRCLFEGNITATLGEAHGRRACLFLYVRHDN